jgi:hypothetical protein
VAWSEAAREQFFLKRYGAEEGAKRFQEWKDQRDKLEDLQPQGGSVVQEKAPQRRRSNKTNAKEMQSGLAVLIAGTDLAVAQVSRQWASVPRLSGSKELLNRYLAEVFGVGGANEVDRLAAALTDVLRNNPWLGRFFDSVKKQGGWVKLVAVISAIIVPRLIQAGIIPNPFAQGAENAAAGMEGGGAHGDHRDDRFGQVAADEQPVAEDENPFRRAEIESRLDAVRRSPNGDPRFGHARPAPHQVGAEAEI